MASSAASKPSVVDPTDLKSFQDHLKNSKRILALLGAGLSASSGLPTFRGAGGLWRTHDATELATPEAFARDPGLVWQFYNYRRHMALGAKPNPAHYALAALAKKRGDEFITLSQNVDGLSPRAGHPAETLKLLHGSLFDLKCSSFFCNHMERDNYTDPVCPALAIPTEPGTDNPIDTTAKRDLDISNISVPLPSIPASELPHCPTCQTGLIRPGVVWFGESLPGKVMDDVDAFFDSGEQVDLIMVIGTSSKVYPAAGYVDDARAMGARVAVVNMDRRDAPKSGMCEGDWMFEGDAAAILPELFREEIGELKEEDMKDLAGN
ncbi:DHS-like NAD/FAD-binding domain-containing protein [Sporormia fimetaria CBS 119925]|uniref:DHS-like NAD/FAD-binding domain-containing protein n=1 Tax=Sporormia fimetaria CBS 119925 TaxID=1340428 RepID=A0A6A6VH69_9PLEO|nr:DHS-like NAD/FAD-binding domain-containing protein [Sporormia fimetaria CBS 119925]